MLIKLIKHDIKSSYRELFPLYMGLLLFSVIAALSVNPEREWLSFVTILPFFALFIATTVILTLTVIKLFTNRLYSKEGYLTFTLPVTTLQTFMSKLITALIWTLLTFFVYLLATALFTGIGVAVNWTNVQYAINVYYKNFLETLPWSKIIPEVIRLFSLSLPQIIISIIYSGALMLITVVFVNTSYVSSKKLVVGIIVYHILNFIFNNISNNLIPDWILVNENIGYNINWTYYILSIVYNLLISIGLISLSVWLNDHKLELE